MLQIQTFTFNPFAENTYLVWDTESLETAIIDPGCSDYEEDMELLTFLESKNLKPTLLLNTHCHIDHVLGNAMIQEKFNLKLQAHELENSVLQWSEQASLLYQIPYTKSPIIEKYIGENNTIQIGEYELSILHTPGHSPGSICFVSPNKDWVIAGDVLFRESIGRTDLPGGDFSSLENSILKKMYSLPDSCIVYSGHGPSTSIGHEKKYNAFVKG